MSEKELFNAVLESLINKYSLTIVYPYHDTCFELFKGDQRVAVMNPSGHNLLVNLRTLTEQLNYELM